MPLHDGDPDGGATGRGMPGAINPFQDRPKGRPQMRPPGFSPRILAYQPQIPVDLVIGEVSDWNRIGFFGPMAYGDVLKTDRWTTATVFTVRHSGFQRCQLQSA
jgi:hypothetical protein